MTDPDELDLRIRSLEAERMRRPVPLPVSTERENESWMRLVGFEKWLKRFGIRAGHDLPHALHDDIPTAEEAEKRP